MSGKLSENKKIKMTKLYDAAYDLFTSNGVRNTIIDDIVKNAGVAKGTFYLYCKDKYDLVDKVILRKTSALLNGAMEALAEKGKTQTLTFQESVIFFADYLIDFFNKDVKFLELIFKNLSLSLFDKAMHCTEMETAREEFNRNFILNGGSVEEAGKRLYIIVCTISSLCYNSIVLKGPYTMDEIRPEMHRSVQRILS